MRANASAPGASPQNEATGANSPEHPKPHAQQHLPTLLHSYTPILLTPDRRPTRAYALRLDQGTGILPRSARALGRGEVRVSTRAADGGMPAKEALTLAAGAARVHRARVAGEDAPEERSLDAPAAAAAARGRRRQG